MSYPLLRNFLLLGSHLLQFLDLLLHLAHQPDPFVVSSNAMAQLGNLVLVLPNNDLLLLQLLLHLLNLAYIVQTHLSHLEVGFIPSNRSVRFGGLTFYWNRSPEGERFLEESIFPF